MDEGNPFLTGKNITGRVVDEKNKEQKSSKIIDNVSYALKMGVMCLFVF